MAQTLRQPDDPFDSFWSMVKLAASQSPSDKIVAGVRLFHAAQSRMLDGLRHEFPEMDDDQLRHELTRRLRISRALERVHG